MRGGRDLFPLLPEAFKGVKQIGVIGWGSQVHFIYHVFKVILFVICYVYLLFTVFDYLLLIINVVFLFESWYLYDLFVFD